MGRKKQAGLTKFQYPTDFNDNDDVCKLMHLHKGSAAKAIYITMIEHILKQGYYIKVCDFNYFRFAVSVFESEEKVRDVLNTCVQLGLFDKTLFERYGVYTSRFIQETFMKSKKMFQHTGKIVEYDLLSIAYSENNSSENTKFDSTVEKATTTDDMRISPTETIISPGNISTSTIITGTSNVNNNISKQEITISQGEKKTKEKEPKRKKNKRSSTTSATPSIVRVCAREGSFDGISVDANQLKEEEDLLRNSPEWQDDIKKYYKLTDTNLEEHINRFFSKCRIMNRTSHKTKEDLKAHFASWLQKELEKRPQTTKSIDYGTRLHSRYSSGIEHTHLDPRRPAPCPVGTTQADYE